MKKKTVVKKGPARMRQLGRVSVVVWLDSDQARDLDDVRGPSPRASFAKYLLGQAIRGLTQFREKP